MLEKPLKIIGKTYSLFGEFESTDYFYNFIDDNIKLLLKNYKSEETLLEDLRISGRSKKNYEEFTEKNNFLSSSKSTLLSFTPGVQTHLKQQSVFKFWDSVMHLKDWQYHLYMLEFALINRLNKEKFLKCDVKVALLPYCLRDLSVECKAAPNGIEYQCKHCSNNCFINEVSKILSEKGIIPYLWMSANLGNIVKYNYAKNESLGVLGIACIPELVRGVRRCQKKKLPVVGIPLDANRCVRWIGKFNPNSINLDILKTLVRK
jgi:uncharacterized protein